MRPMAMPDTCPRVGTPASISDSDDEQTEPIDVEPFDERTSETRRSAYGNFSCDGPTDWTMDFTASSLAALRSVLSTMVLALATASLPAALTASYTSSP